MHIMKNLLLIQKTQLFLVDSHGDNSANLLCSTISTIKIHLNFPINTIT